MRGELAEVRAKRTHRNAGNDVMRGRIAELRDATSRGVEKLCSTSGKRSYSSRGAAIRGGSERYGVSTDAYRCSSCGGWHCTRSQTPHEPGGEVVEAGADQAASALVDALGIGVEE